MEVSNAALCQLPTWKNQENHQRNKEEKADANIACLPGCISPAENLAPSDNGLFNMEKIKLSLFEISAIPEKMGAFKDLTDLNLSNKSILELPDKISELLNLESLNLSNNLLKDLPVSLKHIKNLKYLNVSHNNLEEVPQVLFDTLNRLKKLDLSHNMIYIFNDPPDCLNSLSELDLSYNQLVAAPEWIFHNMCRLKKINLRSNKFQHSIYVILTDVYSLGPFQTILELDIRHCNLNDKKMEFLSHLKNLKTLKLGNYDYHGRNFFGNLEPNKFFCYPNLENLYIERLGISTLPSDVNFFHGIKILDLSYNFLSWLPDSFCQLLNLEVCFLKSNMIVYLPKNIGNLISLREIHLGCNSLSELPDSFSNLKNLEYTDFYSNKIESINLNVLAMPSLKGIDLEYNMMSTEEFSKEHNYEELRRGYRVKFGIESDRSNGQRARSLTASEIDEYEPSYLSDEAESELRDFSKLSIDNSCDAVITETEVCEDVDWGDAEKETHFSALEPLEDWNECSNGDLDRTVPDEDLDDLFDPNDVKPMTSRPYIRETHLETAFRNNFCPADWHPSQNFRRVILNNRRRKFREPAVEGQFELE